MEFGPYPVTEISHTNLKLSDGTRLAMKVWLPCLQHNIEKKFSFFNTEESRNWMKNIYTGTQSVNADFEELFPVILEYLPYAKDSSMTLARDHARHPWFCSHGFLVIRVDLRGTGASSGVYYEEYDAQEFDDCTELFNWIESQSWSNGKIGMYGKSWGGFNGVQLAYKQHKALRAVISLYSTDNRFSDDIHYQGSTMIGNGMLSWASFMFAHNARPPHPRYFKTTSDWKEFWLKRLENTGQSCLATWLHHQHKLDPFWQHGSICQNISKVQCPVLVVGGHADAYTNATFRMAATLNQSSRAIIGPWTHDWPDVSNAGPKIDFLKLCLEWWTFHLKDNIPFTDVLAWPRLKLFVRDSIKPDEIVGPSPGTWVAIPNWKVLYNNFKLSAVENPSTSNDNNVTTIFFGANMKLQFNKVNHIEERVELHPHVLQGSGSGPWLAFYDEFPDDQGIANEHSSCWITNVLDQDIVFVGFSKVFIYVEARVAGRYSLQVRICDQFPSGESTLITKGCQNLCDAEDGWVTPFPGQEKRMICIDLNATGYAVKAGHQVLLSVSPTYFPSVYPAVHCEGLCVYPGCSFMMFQTLTATELRNTTCFRSPKPLLKLPVNDIIKRSYTVTSSIDGDKFVQEVNEMSGLTQFPTMKYECEGSVCEKYVTDQKVSYGDISAARVISSVFEIEGEGKVNTSVKTYQSMTGDKQCFKIKENLKVQIDGETLFDKTWDNIIPRKYV